jgi:phosphoglycerol transferase MdoB-like AlkP superfamily enzyme
MIRRPGVITFIGVIMFIQATMAVVSGIVLVALSGEQRIIDETSLDRAGLITAGIVSLIISAIIFLVALALLRGSKGARILVTIVQVIAVASAAWTMFTHHTGAFLFQGLITTAIAIFVLWALYNERSEEYFNSL